MYHFTILRSTVKVTELRHVSILSCESPLESVIKISINIPEDNPQEKVQTCRSSNALIAKSSCCIILAVHVLVYS
jgi:hypothetical protein